MDYLEIEGKAQLRRFGIPTNDSILLEGDEIPAGITYPCVLKGQILAGHRGQAGAVRVVKSEKELRESMKTIEGITINGQVMEGIIACRFLPIVEEYYLGMTLDVKNRAMIMLFTTEGGWISRSLQRQSLKNYYSLTVQKDLTQMHFAKRQHVLPSQRNVWITLLTLFKS